MHSVHQSHFSCAVQEPRQHLHQNDYTSDSGRSEGGPMPRGRHHHDPQQRQHMKQNVSRQDKGSMTGATNLHLECRPSMLSGQRIALTQHSGESCALMSAAEVPFPAVKERSEPGLSGPNAARRHKVRPGNASLMQGSMQAGAILNASLLQLLSCMRPLSACSIIAYPSQICYQIYTGAAGGCRHFESDDAGADLRQCPPDRGESAEVRNTGQPCALAGVLPA